MAIDLWSLGTTIAQFFTPLQLNPSSSPLSSPTLTAADEVDEIISSPFIIPDILRKNIDYHATWERRTLFDGERGELGLAWSIFRLRGTPNENTWPASLFSLWCIVVADVCVSVIQLSARCIESRVS
jgi:cell division cycle 2-like